ncbi:MAG: hypothetical protein ACYTGL_20520 [Planctomycetota bacterium]
MDASKPELDQQTQATLLLAGLITSGLFVLAATVLWGAFLLTMSSDTPLFGDFGFRGFLVCLLTVVNAFIFYWWGLIGLWRSVKHLRRLTRR